MRLKANDSRDRHSKVCQGQEVCWRHAVILTSAQNAREAGAGAYLCFTCRDRRMEKLLLSSLCPGTDVYSPDCFPAGCPVAGTHLDLIDALTLWSPIFLGYICDLASLPSPQGALSRNQTQTLTQDSIQLTFS